MKQTYNTIPQWIYYYGIFLALLIIGFGSMFFLNSDPFVVGDPSFAAGVRNMGVLIILLLGLWYKNASILFCAFVLRFSIDLGDMINTLLAGSYIQALSFIPIIFIPTFFGIRILWNIMNQK